MGWNGSGGAETPQKPRTTAKKPSPRRGIIAGALVCVLAIGAYFVFFSGSEKPQNAVAQNEEVQKKPIKIREALPAPAPKPVVEEEDLGWATNRKGQVVKRNKIETYRDEKGVLRYKAGGARAPEKDEFKNAVRVQMPTTHPEFRHNCENEIATIITTEPGDMLFGSVTIDERFKNDFINALMEPVEINPEDSERDKAIKAMVEEEKHVIAARLKEGETLEAIFTEAREEARRLAAIKSEALQMVREATADGEMTDDEVEDYYKAANRLLEEKGIEPIKYGSFMKRRAMLMSIRKE